MGVTKLEADFRIVTPLFMGGAKPEIPELRVPGIKGALRFWWRALAYSTLSGDMGKIKELEGQIFGSTKHGQSRVLIELREKPKPELDYIKIPGPGLRYLSYGLIDPNRNYLKAPFDATIHLTIRPKGTDRASLDDTEIAKQIACALRTMGLFGGLGSRTRRGFGSLNLLELREDGVKVFEQPLSVDDPKKQIKDQIMGYFREMDLYKGTPEFSAFSSGTAVYIFGDVYDDSLKLLDSVGRSMQMYRVGSRDRIAKVKRNFLQDTQLAKRALNSKVQQHPRRAFFGLPHNYHFPKLERLGNGASLDVKPKKHDRRASPLLIHVHELNGRNYVAAATLMPAVFLPENDCILMKRQKNGEIGSEPIESFVRVDPDEARSLQVIRDLLDSMWEKVIPV